MIFMTNYIEHVVDPEKELALAFAYLKDGAVFGESCLILIVLIGGFSEGFGEDMFLDTYFNLMQTTFLLCW